jgi:hypothetical protein
MGVLKSQNIQTNQFLEEYMALSLKPLGNRLVVEPIEQEEITAGGIVLPETAKEKPQKGKVHGCQSRRDRVIRQVFWY